MIGAATTIFALKASLSEPIDVRLLRVKKSLTAVEQSEVKPVDKLARALIKVLNSVKNDPTATSEQVALVAEYRARTDNFDPRNPENRLADDEPGATDERPEEAPGSQGGRRISKKISSTQPMPLPEYKPPMVTRNHTGAT